MQLSSLRLHGRHLRRRAVDVLVQKLLLAPHRCRERVDLPLLRGQGRTLGGELRLQPLAPGALLLERSLMLFIDLQHEFLQVGDLAGGLRSEPAPVELQAASCVADLLVHLRSHLRKIVAKGGEALLVLAERSMDIAERRDGRW